MDKLSKLDENFTALAANLDMFFLLVMGVIVYFMQCGFAFLECGAVRSKNSTNILIKNVMDSFVGCLAYWVVGYGLAFGTGGPVIGMTHWALHDVPDTVYAHWFFQFVFAATAATIVSGAMAERCDFLAYLTYSVAITGFIYPVVTHWAWTDEGWLSSGMEACCECVPHASTNGSLVCNASFTVSYQDFAGSGVVHLLGGTAAFVGAAILGARRGRFDPSGKPKHIRGHSVPLAALGGFILFFGFFAFNGGSQGQISASGDGVAVALSMVNTTISGSFAALTCLITTLITRLVTKGQQQWSLLVTINGCLTGMVAICAGCNVVYPWGAAVIGVVAGFAYKFWSFLVLKIKVDDPLDAIAVHGGGGLWGVIAVPLLKTDGLFLNWGTKGLYELAWNLAGAAAIMGWSAVLALILFGMLRFTGLLRVTSEIEHKGMDIPKHGEPAYPLHSYGHGWEAHDPIDINMLREYISQHPTANGIGYSTKSNGGETTIMDVLQENDQTPVSGNGVDNPALDPSGI